jgi:twinkle protein
MTSKVIGRSQCPRCAARGGDTSHNNLHHYDDGHSYCFACGSLEGRVSSVFKELEPVAIESRGISYETVAKYGVGIDSNDVLCFPYYHEGSVVSYKERNFPERDFKWNGDTSRSWLFGIHVCSLFGTLVIVEGETDTLAVAEAFRTSSKAYCVVGIAKGASSAERAVKTHLEWIRKFKKVVVLLDNDEAGQQALQSVVKVLPPGRTHVASLPTGIKDPNDLLLEDPEALRNAVINAVAITPTSVVDASRLVNDSLDFYYNREAMLGISTGSEGLDWLIGGWGEGTVVTLVGDTGVGKTTFATWLAHNAGSEKHPVFWIGLEMTPRQQLLKLAEFHLRKPFVSKPFEFEVLPEELRDGLKCVASRIKFYDHYGAMSKDLLIDSIEVAADAFDCKLIVLDHISAAAGSDWKELDAMIAALKGVALQKNIAILVLAHVTIEKKEDKDGATRLKLGHIRGSRSIAQYSDAVLGIERDRKTSATSVRTLKLHRTVSVYGEVLFDLSGGEYQQVAVLDAEGNVTEPPKQGINKKDKKYTTIKVTPNEYTTTAQPSETDNSEAPQEKRVRAKLPPRRATATLRAVSNTISVRDDIQPGLHLTSEPGEIRDSPRVSETEPNSSELQASRTNSVSRDEGVLQTERQSKTSKVPRAVARVNSSRPPVPEWKFDTL